MWTHRDQFSHQQIPVDDDSLIYKQHDMKLDNHSHSETCKQPLKDIAPGCSSNVCMFTVIEISHEHGTDVLSSHVMVNGVTLVSLLDHNFGEQHTGLKTRNVTKYHLKNSQLSNHQMTMITSRMRIMVQI